MQCVMCMKGCKEWKELGRKDGGWGLGGEGGGRLDGLSDIVGWGCGMVMVRVGEGLEEGLWKN